jgi:hypothetical protein
MTSDAVAEDRMLKNTGNTFKTQLALVILSLVGVGLVLLSTSRYGVGISPDSTQYISTARSLLAGNGYLGFDDAPFRDSPPLFAALLAFLGAIGIEPLIGARFLNAFAFGLIILLSGRLFLTHVRSKVLVVLGTTTILLSVPLFSVSVMAWTEPVFVLLSVLFVIYLSEFLDENRLSVLFLVSILVGLACLQRFIGITLVLTGFVLIVSSLPKVSLLGRSKYAVVFAGISVVPVLIWIIQSYVLTSTLTGGRSPSRFALSQSIVQTLSTMAIWFVPRGVPSWMKMVGLGLVLSVMLVTPVSLCYRSRREASINSKELMEERTAGAFVLVYALALIVYSAIFDGEKIADRLLAPMYVLIMFMVFVGIEQVSNFLNVRLRRPALGTFAVILLCTLWLTYPLARVSEHALSYARNGPPGFNTVAWRESPTIQWLQAHPLEGKVYSNAPDVVYILTGRAAHLSPCRSVDVSELRNSLSSGLDHYVVWFDIGWFDEWRSHCYDMRKLASIFDIEEVATFSDGGIYLLR